MNYEYVIEAIQRLKTEALEEEVRLTRLSADSYGLSANDSRDYWREKVSECEAAIALLQVEGEGK